MEGIALNISIDWTDREIFIGASSNEWGIKAVAAPESFFSWDIYHDVSAWLATKPKQYDVRAFSSIVESRGGRPNALVLSILRGGFLFGYDAPDGFWGGVISRATFYRIWDTVSQLAAKFNEVEDVRASLEDI